jgi:hypothetical protein
MLLPRRVSAPLQKEGKKQEGLHTRIFFEERYLASVQPTKAHNVSFMCQERGLTYKQHS